jgi:hypothetical protein
MLSKAAGMHVALLLLSIPLTSLVLFGMSSEAKMASYPEYLLHFVVMFTIASAMA